MAAVTTKEHLIVAGGYRGGVGILTTVEVMDTRTLVWTAVASLPHPYRKPSVTICGDQLYMLGGVDDKQDQVSTDLVHTKCTHPHYLFLLLTSYTIIQPSLSLGCGCS